MVTFWVILGLGLIGAEFFLPGLVAASTGVAAVIAAGLAWWQVPVWGQVGAWITLSGILITLSRRLVPQGSVELEESREARSLSAIPAGEKGRVAYLGSTWDARCTIPTLTIEANQDLYVVERQGNTLLVMPRKLLEG